MSSYFEKCKELDFDDSNWKSYFFAECSRLAYHDGTRAKRHFKQIGFTTYKFFDVEGAQCHIAQSKDVIIIAFRGTEPKEFSDIKADLNAFKGKSRTEGMVHNGFKNEIDKLWADVSVSLQRIGKRKLYGSPRVGGKEFVRNCLVDHYRHVNNNDIVTSVPFWIMGFRHHGDLTYINTYGNIRQLTIWQRVKDQWRGRWAAIKKFQLFDGIRDHSMGSYSEYLKRRVD